MADVGEVWFVEFEGARVIAVVVPGGVVLSLRDPQSESGAAIVVPKALNDALPVAARLLKKHLRSERHCAVDSDMLSSLGWQHVERELCDAP